MWFDVRSRCDTVYALRMNTARTVLNLRARRERAGLSQAQLAAQANLTQRALSYIERRERAPRAATAARIEAALRALEVRDTQSTSSAQRTPRARRESRDAR
jgi:transcriptional regulator with XRE-family HTH domain